MGYINLKISGKNGKMYESSKEVKEGYVEVKYGKDNLETTYHKYYDKIEGEFSGFGISEMKSEKANITMLNVKIKGTEDIYTISVPLKTTYGGISDSAKALISSFNNAKPNHGYSVTTFTKKNEYNGKTYDNQVVYVNSLTEMGDNGKGLSTGFIPFSEIPRAKREDDGLGGVTYDNKEVNLFFGAKIREISAKFEGEVKPATDAPEPKTAKLESEVSKKKEAVIVDDEDDSLPF